MQKQAMLYGVVGLIVGALASGLLVAHFTGNQAQHSAQKDGAMAMAGTADSLQSKTGDDFDEAFIAGMIEHHQGAIDMAALAKQNTKHDEIKHMADDIIAVQSKEIGTMQQWQTEWGYNEDNTPQSHQQMDH